MKKETKPLKASIRLTSEAERIIDRFMAEHGLNRTAVIEMALRHLDREGTKSTNVR